MTHGTMSLKCKCYLGKASPLCYFYTPAKKTIVIRVYTQLVINHQLK